MIKYTPISLNTMTDDSIKKDIEHMTDYKFMFYKVIRDSFSIVDVFLEVPFAINDIMKKHHNIENDLCYNDRYRFDIAIPSIMVYFEYDGGVFDVREKDKVVNKSGHRTVKGYTSDVMKFNKATLLGWYGFKVTATTIGNGEFKKTTNTLREMLL